MADHASAARGVGFVVLADSSFLERACADLTEQSGFTKRTRGLWVPTEILGMWVGPEPEIVRAGYQEADDAPSLCPRVELNCGDSFGFAGRWMMVSLEVPFLTRLGLLDKLVGSGAAPRADHEPRFVPVFSRLMSASARRNEVARLRRRHPHEVRAPLLMNPMTGSLTHPHDQLADSC